MLRLLGTTSVDHFDQLHVGAPPQRLFALVARLSFLPNRHEGRSALAALLWEKSETRRAQASLRHLLAVTRRWQAATGISVVETSADYVYRSDACAPSDLDAFLGLTAIDSPSALDALGGLYRGDLLDGFPELGSQFDDWLASQRELLRERFVSLVIAAADRPGEPIGETALRHVLQLYPFDERAVRALMRTLSRKNEVDAALACFEALQSRLRDHLNSRPQNETLSLAQHLATKSSIRTIMPALVAQEPNGPSPIGHGNSASVTFRSPVPRLMILLPGEDTPRIAPQTRLLVRALIEDVTTNLSRLQALAVIAPHTAARVDLVDARTAALLHRIDYVAESALRRSADGHRLEIKLLHVETAELLWADNFTFSDLRRPQALQELAQWLATIVTSAVERREMRALSSEGPLAAYRHYLMGRHSLRTINLEGIRRARKWFQQAVHLNPAFAPAHSWLAHCAILEWMVFSHSGPELLYRASEAAQSAIDLDPTDGNGHRELARAALFLGRLDESLELFQHAEGLAPHHADLLADYADTLMHNSQPEAAKARIDQALSLNPLAPDVYYWIAGGISFFSGDPTGALQLLKKMRKPDQAFKLMAASAALSGDRAEAILFRDRALHNDPDFDLRTWSLRLPQRERAHLDMYVEALRAAGFV